MKCEEGFTIFAEVFNIDLGFLLPLEIGDDGDSIFDARVEISLMIFLNQNI